MRLRAGLLQILAATAWTAAAVGMFTGYDDHWGFSGWGSLDGRIWIGVLSVAIVSTILAAQQKTARTHLAASVTAATRPRADQPSGEFPALRVAEPYTLRARDASQG